MTKDEARMAKRANPSGVEGCRLIWASGFGLRASRRSGFSLVEIMVVVVIIGLLAGVVTYATTGMLDKAKRRKAAVDISSLTGALDIYYGDHGRFPSNQEGLAALAPQYVKVVQNDPWGRPYLYVQPGRGGAYDVISFGADGREGGTGADADITNTDKEVAAVKK
jgi:general secretion pathway protein G